MRQIKSVKDLYVILTCLTFLFITAQLSFFIVHYQISDLIDSLTKSSIAHEMFHPVVLIPILLFIALQISAYGLYVFWIGFISISLSEFFKRSGTMAYWLGMVLWMFGVITILLLNNVYFPGSFFARPFQQNEWLVHIQSIVLFFNLALLLAATLLAYLNVCLTKRHYKAAGFFLLLAFLIGASFIHEKLFSFSQPSHKPHSKPDIILIGMDSLRPDFTGFYGNPRIHTPNIDHFFQSATAFTAAYTPLARTFPSWVSILTAKYPKHHDARANLADPENIYSQDNLAKQLRLAGYETIYATDEKRFSNITKAYGFDRVIGPSMGIHDFLLGGLSDFPLTNLLVNLPIGKFLFPYNYANRAASVTYEPDNFLKLVQQSLANRQDKPLFLAVHLCLSHWPFTWASKDQANRTLAAKYFNSVEAVDRQLGELMKVLESAGLLEHSLVGLLSDHGTALGLLGDRELIEKKYIGDAKSLRFISANKLSTVQSDSLDFKKGYTINTAYGQGTDVLSLKQYRIILGFRGYGIKIPAQRISEMASLIDIAPTILDYFHLAPLKEADGISFANPFLGKGNQITASRPFFFETGDSFDDLETDNISVNKVVKQGVVAYHLNLNNGLLYLSKEADKAIILHKQRAVMDHDWLLAIYPAKIQAKLAPLTSGSQKIVVKHIMNPPYVVLINLKTGQWTMDLSSPYAKGAPIDALLKQLNAFYGDEIPRLVNR